jgi:E3 ubiquitin-protein ligase HECTD1
MSSDFDSNGLLYFIGSNEGRNSYRNPAQSGKVQLVTSHPMFEPSMHAYNIVGRSDSTNFWGGSAPQFFTLDLKNYEIFATHFTIKHGYHVANSFIQGFQLQGSKDGKTWLPVHEQLETPFTKAYDTATFRIWDGRDYFRHWRLVQHGNYCMGPGKGTSGGAPYMCLSGFELYGEVRYEEGW